MQSIRFGYMHFRLCAAIVRVYYKPEVRSALSLPHTSRAPGLETPNHARARDLSAAPGNTREMEATSVSIFRMECQGCSITRSLRVTEAKPPLPAPPSPLVRAQSSILQCTRRLADKARQAGGRRVYSLKPIFHHDAFSLLARTR